MGRVRQAGKNIFFGYISNFIILCMGFLQRTVFIGVLGETLLGVNGLYTDILSMLSLAELGIGSAMNYSLYKPVANGDQEKIKSYMGLYRKAYLAIAGVITVIGLALSDQGQRGHRGQGADDLLSDLFVQYGQHLFCGL